jgi:hypothetical protein
MAAGPIKNKNTAGIRHNTVGNNNEKDAWLARSSAL